MDSFGVEAIGKPAAQVDDWHIRQHYAKRGAADHPEEVPVLGCQGDDRTPLRPCGGVSVKGLAKLWNHQRHALEGKYVDAGPSRTRRAAMGSYVPTRDNVAFTC